MTVPDQMSFSEYQEKELGRRGITVMEAVVRGVTSITDDSQIPEGYPDYWTVENGYLPGLLIPWTAGDGRVEYQLRPDNPPLDRNDRPMKYVFRSREQGYEPTLWLARKGIENGKRLLVEGTCQTLAASIHVPQDIWVYGIQGCRGWMTDGSPIVDLSAFDSTEVIVALDADMWTNPNVWDAGELLQRALLVEGADSVSFLKLPAGGKAGLDDVLGSRPADRRSGYMERLLSSTVTEKFPKSRRPKSADDDGDVSPFFNSLGGLKVRTLAQAVYAKTPCALTQEETIAVYRNGVFGINNMAFTSVVADLLGEDYRLGHQSNVQGTLVGKLYESQLVLPERSLLPLLNVRNGMLDLTNAMLYPHDPKYLSYTQFPIEWNPEAKAPFYEDWINTHCPDQVDDLEEVTSTMLDPSTVPNRAIFLFGLSRSGKGTYLRIMKAVAGAQNTSGVTLHQLADDRFAIANIYGKVLNVAGDLSSIDVSDISAFKSMTGEDLMSGNRKYGKQFSFVNKALFAFAANTVPAVSEESAAYVNRMKPFHFPITFAGHEDPVVENRLMAELPGILVRWVKAGQRVRGRGYLLAGDLKVKAMFARSSDRAEQFRDEVLTVVHLDQATVRPDQMSTPTELAQAFRRWAEANNGSSMGRNTLITRLKRLDGVVEVTDIRRRRGLNLVVRPEQDWGYPDDEPVIKEKIVLHQREQSCAETAQSAPAPVPAGNAAPLMPCMDCGTTQVTFGSAGILRVCPTCYPDTSSS
jgi:putative DNA primase/helicase